LVVRARKRTTRHTRAPRRGGTRRRASARARVAPGIESGASACDRDRPACYPDDLGRAADLGGDAGRPSLSAPPPLLSPSVAATVHGRRRGAIGGPRRPGCAELLSVAHPPNLRLSESVESAARIVDQFP